MPVFHLHLKKCGAAEGERPIVIVVSTLNAILKGSGHVTNNYFVILYVINKIYLDARTLAMV